MLTILIVDDEKTVRRWFTYCLEKINGDYKVVGEAANGHQALEIFNQELPDVVITDIKMPVMDGLELIEQVKKIRASTMVVVLTCHAEFDFARKAFQLGATEYILKTEVEEEDVEEVLNRLESIKVSQASENKTQDLKVQIKRDAFIRDLLKGRVSNEDIIAENLNKLKIFLKNGNVFFLAIFVHMEEQKAGEDFLNKIMKFGETRGCYWFRYEDILLMLGSLDEFAGKLQQTNYLHELSCSIKKSALCSIGISDVHYGYKKVPTALEEAIKALEQQYFSGKGSVIHYYTLTDTVCYMESILKIQKEIQKLLEEKNNIAVPHKISEFFKIINSVSGWDVGFIQKAVVDMLAVLRQHTSYWRQNIEKFGEESVNKNIRCFKYIQKMESYIYDISEKMLSNQGNSALICHSSISKAIKYIDAHYAEPLTLNDVSGYVHMNPDYFSRLLKEATELNFSNYLIMTRLKKAEELLKNTNLKIYEISEMVGYPNKSYFSRIYKKYMGITAYELRMMSE